MTTHLLPAASFPTKNIAISDIDNTVYIANQEQQQQEDGETILSSSSATDVHI
jgi:hypothetical protein